MNEIIVKENVNIKDMIYEIRGKQVILDSDVAMLFGYETKQLQQTLSNLLENTKQVIELTDSTYNKNKLINGFNGFCERYTRELNSYLYSKSVHVPWHISGRGGINISRYNKKMDQLNNKLMKVTKLLENQRKFIKSQKVKLDKIKKVS